ncbi:MAG: cardiolipin synthase [Thermodesulfobacteriota bacterium]
MSVSVVISLLASLLHLLGILSAVHAIMASRTAQGAIAWGMALTSMPYLSLPIYWTLGRNRFQGYITARCHRDDLTGLSIGHCRENVTPYISSAHQHDIDIRAVERLAKIPFLTSNEVDLLIDGTATFSSIISGIDQAKAYILIQFFIVKDDKLGRRLQRHLIAKAKEGVAIYFLYDEVGSHELPSSYIAALRRAGVEVHSFNASKSPFNRFQLNFRNHRKVLVVDGAAAWLGGHNVGDTYLGRNPKFGHWRDTHIKLKGPAVKAVQVTFLEDYNWATGELLELDWQVAPTDQQAHRAVLIVPSGPADALETAALMFTHLINSAEKRLWIASPYFVPDRAILSALQLAGLRGVDVRILIPDRPDHLMVYLAAFSYFDEAGATGVSFYRYGAGFLHQKVILLDDHLAGVGTANFDNRSFRLNFEITALVHDPLFAGEVAEMLEDDFAQAKRLGPGEFADKPFHFKVAVRLTRLMSPLL